MSAVRQPAGRPVGGQFASTGHEEGAVDIEDTDPSAEAFERLDWESQVGPAAAVTHVGNIRQNNEDACIIRDRRWLLADGMGGHDSGEVASRVALETIDSYLAGGPVTGLAVREAMDAADQAVVAEIQARGLDHGHRSAGTTVVVAAMHEDGKRIVGGWCGDSRAYCFDPEPDEDGTRLRSITIDQAYPEGGLKACIGHLSRSSMGPETFELETKPGRRLLICSDGLSGEVSWPKLTKIMMAGDDGPTTARALVDEALRNGGRDNVTVVVVDASGEN